MIKILAGGAVGWLAVANLGPFFVNGSGPLKGAAFLGTNKVDDAWERQQFVGAALGALIAWRFL